ncbi:MAG TPA: hypothetical protein VLG50_02385 [Candidatus Saccharimonadales bacterium]|nr:hypothetical protein [Candidatus Saccharimonadales bacterium]
MKVNTYIYVQFILLFLSTIFLSASSPQRNQSSIPEEPQTPSSRKKIVGNILRSIDPAGDNIVNRMERDLLKGSPKLRTAPKTVDPIAAAINKKAEEDAKMQQLLLQEQQQGQGKKTKPVLKVSSLLQVPVIPPQPVIGVQLRTQQSLPAAPAAQATARFDLTDDEDQAKLDEGIHRFPGIIAHNRAEYEKIAQEDFNKRMQRHERLERTLPAQTGLHDPIQPTLDHIDALMQRKLGELRKKKATTFEQSFDNVITQFNDPTLSFEKWEWGKSLYDHLQNLSLLYNAPMSIKNVSENDYGKSIENNFEEIRSRYGKMSPNGKFGKARFYVEISDEERAAFECLPLSSDQHIHMVNFPLQLKFCKNGRMHMVAFPDFHYGLCEIDWENNVPRRNPLSRGNDSDDLDI